MLPFFSAGHFLFIFGNKNRRIASLESETMMAVDKACLELWHLSKWWGSERKFINLFILQTLNLSVTTHVALLQHMNEWHCFDFHVFI